MSSDQLIVLIPIRSLILSVAPGFFDFERAATHSLQVIQRFPAPTGKINCRDGENFLTQSAFASMVKYVARHVSQDLPPPLIPYGQGQEDPHHAILKRVLTGFDISTVPTPFGTLIESLRLDRSVQLDKDLFQAAFASEIMGKYNFVETLARDENYQNRITFGLLKGAGYEVNL
jgi:hypothetical protein